MNVAQATYPTTNGTIWKDCCKPIPTVNDHHSNQNICALSHFFQSLSKVLVFLCNIS